MKEGYYWYKNDYGIWNPVCIIQDYTYHALMVFHIGYNKPDKLENIDITRFGPEIILPKELQDDNSTKPS